MLRTGIIGAGKIGTGHISHIRDHPEATVSGVCDINSARLEELNGRIKTYTSLEKMLDKENLDSVHVCTPPQTHLELAKRVLSTDIPVLLEKPAVMDLNEMEELQAAADQYKTPVSVVHNQLFFPFVQRALRYVDEGRIGDVVAVTLIHTEKFDLDDPHRNEWVFDLPGGEIGEGLPHQIYLPLAFVNGLGEIRNVEKHQYNEYKKADFDGITIQATDSEARREITIKIMTSTVEHKSLIRVHGTEGELLIDFMKYGAYLNTTQQRFAPASLFIDSRELGRQIYSNALKITRDRLVYKLMKAINYTGPKRHKIALRLPKNGHYIQFDKHIKALQDKADPPVSLNEAHDTIRVLDSI